MNTDGNMDAIERHLADCEEHDAWQDLQDQLEAARADAKEAEAYAEELEKAMKKDYNDGTIHGWNGGDCPVHPETVVKVWFRVGSRGEKQSGNYYWGCSGANSDIIAFRVVKEYVEPKVIWVNEYANGDLFAYWDEKHAKRLVGSDTTRIAVKYVECKE